MRCKALGLKVVVVTRLPKAVKAVELNQLFETFWWKAEAISDYPYTQAANEGWQIWSLLRAGDSVKKRTKFVQVRFWCVRVWLVAFLDILDFFSKRTEIHKARYHCSHLAWWIIELLHVIPSGFLHSCPSRGSEWEVCHGAAVLMLHRSEACVLFSTDIFAHWQTYQGRLVFPVTGSNLVQCWRTVLCWKPRAVLCSIILRSRLARFMSKV